MLDADDWEELKIVFTLLKPFYQLTLHLESQVQDGQCGAIWETLLAMDLLLSYLEIVKNKYQYSTYSYISTCINNGWLVLNKYYTCTDVSPVYITAVVLNPR